MWSFPVRPPVPPSPAVERFNAASHLLGALLAVAGTAGLLVSAAGQGDVRRLVSFSIYGASLVLLFSISALAHFHEQGRRRWLTRLDHCTIYLLIAGTYTPFTLVTLQGAWGWSLFGVVWGLALAGVVLDLLWQPTLRILPVAIYLVMGWLMIIALRPLLQRLAEEGFMLLLAGGIAYTLGVPFFGLSRYRPALHCVWHLLVLLGSLLHFLAVWWHVAPA